jgi:hypothetical protein
MAAVSNQKHSRWRGDGYSQAKSSGPKEHQEGCQSRPAEENHFPTAQEDPDSPRQRRGQGSREEKTSFELSAACYFRSSNSFEMVAAFGSWLPKAMTQP